VGRREEGVAAGGRTSICIELNEVESLVVPENSFPIAADKYELVMLRRHLKAHPSIDLKPARDYATCKT
jgi:hypothetical protein